MTEVHWQERIKVVGGEAAYDEFVLSIASSSVRNQHDAAHIFGAALYAEMGAEGVVVCDERFSGGCFHQFMGEAITHQGASVVSKLAAACTSTNSIFCAHGVGHGLIAYVGYGRSDLDNALAGCGFFGDEYLRSCYNGVFMEYEERTTLGPDAVDMPLKGNWYEPCDSLSGTKRSLCMFHQPKWWWDLLVDRDHTEKDIAKKMGELCTGAGKETNVCFKGVGSTFGLKAEETNAPSLCAHVSSDPKRLLLCSKSTAKTFVEAGRSSSESCGHLLPDQRPACEAYAHATSTAETDFSHDI